VVVQEPDVEAEDPTVVVEADLDPVHLGTLVVGSDEVLVTVLGVLDLVAQLPGRPRHEHLLGPGVHDLDPEPPADIGRDALDLREGQLEQGRDGEPHAGRGLGGRVHTQALVVGVPAGEHAAALERGRSRPLDVQPELEAVGGGRDRGRGVPDRLGQRRGDVARDVVVDEVGGLVGTLGGDHRRERLVADPDAIEHVLGGVAVASDDHRHRFTDVVHLAVGQRVLGPWLGQGRVRDQQRQRPAQVGGQIVVGVDRDQPVDVEGLGDVDVEDAGVGMRAAHHRHLVRVVPEIVEEATLAPQQARVLHASDRGTELSGRHEAPSSPRPGSGGPSGRCRARGSAPVSARVSAACATACRMLA
jgi:hypothetical protein